MIGLIIKTWGAGASIVVDPISLAIRYGDHSIGVRESALAVGIDLRSEGVFSTSVSGLSEASSAPLIPTITIPVLAEVIFDLTVSDFSISPMLTVSSENVIDDIKVDFDVELDTFIESFDLGDIFSNITSLLNEIANYGPDFTVGDTPTALIGLFEVVNEAKEFGSALQEFIGLADDGEFCIYSFLVISTE